MHLINTVLVLPMSYCRASYLYWGYIVTETTHDLDCGIPRQKVPCLPLSRSARWMVHRREGTPAGQFSSGQPEALTDLQLQQIPTKIKRKQLQHRSSTMSGSSGFCWRLLIF